MSERELQVSVVDFLAIAAPAGLWWTAVNPIPSKSKAAAGLSKAMGLRPGTPDIVACWRGILVGIELKAAAGRLSPAQKLAHRDIVLAGGVVTTCRSVGEVADFLGGLGGLGVPLRARLAA